MTFEAKNGAIYMNDQKVSFRSLNFFGMEEASGFALHGLWAQPLSTLIGILKTNGFNFVRMTLSMEFMLNMDTYKVDYIGANPQYNGYTAGQLLDVVVKQFADAGIAIMFNLHDYGSDGIAALWYTSAFPESSVIQAWQILAKRYINAPNVIAFDLKNEPHGNCTWGGDASTDWAAAAERIGNAVLSVNPKLLIFVAGVTPTSNSIWGDNISGALTRPIKLNVANKCVLTPHAYKHWNYPSTNGFNNTQYLDSCFGNVIRQSGSATVFVGEYGYDETNALDCQWVNEFCNYVNNLGIGGQISLWAFNNNSSGNQGLLESDWLTVKPSKMALVAKYCPNPTHFNFSSTPSPSPPQPQPTPTPTPAPAPQPSPAPGPSSSALSFTVAQQSSWKSGNDTIFQQVVTVTNTGKTTVKNAVISVSGAKVTSFYSLTQNGNNFSFPSWLVQNG